MGKCSLASLVAFVGRLPDGGCACGSCKGGVKVVEFGWAVATLQPLRPHLE